MDIIKEQHTYYQTFTTSNTTLSAKVQIQWQISKGMKYYLISQINKMFLLTLFDGNVHWFRTSQLDMTMSKKEPGKWIRLVLLHTWRTPTKFTNIGKRNLMRNINLKSFKWPLQMWHGWSCFPDNWQKKLLFWYCIHEHNIPPPSKKNILE